MQLVKGNMGVQTKKQNESECPVSSMLCVAMSQRIMFALFVAQREQPTPTLVAYGLDCSASSKVQTSGVVRMMVVDLAGDVTSVHDARALRATRLASS